MIYRNAQGLESACGRMRLFFRASLDRTLDESGQFPRSFNRTAGFSFFNYPPGYPAGKSFFAVFVYQIGYLRLAQALEVGGCRPRAGFIRISNGASSRKLNPREPLSNWSDETPRSAIIPSTPLGASRSTMLAMSEKLA